jgi:hypothetical protein
MIMMMIYLFHNAWFLACAGSNATTWQTGTALSSGDPSDLVWDECTLTELRNGSILMSARIDDPMNIDRHHPDTNTTRLGSSRGFARSDDGVGLRRQTFMPLRGVHA